MKKEVFVSVDCASCGDKTSSSRYAVKSFLSRHFLHDVFIWSSYVPYTFDGFVVHFGRFGDTMPLASSYLLCCITHKRWTPHTISMSSSSEKLRADKIQTSIYLVFYTLRAVYRAHTQNTTHFYSFFSSFYWMAMVMVFVCVCGYGMLRLPAASATTVAGRRHKSTWDVVYYSLFFLSARKYNSYTWVTWQSIGNRRRQTNLIRTNIDTALLVINVNNILEIFFFASYIFSRHTHFRWTADGGPNAN